MSLFSVAKIFLHALPAETAHDAALFALRHGLVPAQPMIEYDSLHTNLWGLKFLNPIGLAAGFDKNAEVVNAASKQGFGFIETGTVTPLAQAGNEKPRVFRLESDHAVINRLGFNNKGADIYCMNLRKRKTLRVVGANIGKNKTSENAVADYVTLLNRTYDLADYITINISSPNTENLRKLQEKEQLGALITALHNARNELAQKSGSTKPILIKIAPDNTQEQFEDIAELALKHAIDGLIVSNTTISRPESLGSLSKNEQGGLSGAPLFSLSTQALRTMHRLTGGNIPLIGVGGISSGKDAYVKIRAGASLIQLYSALVYEGFDLITRMKYELAELLDRDGFKNVKEAVGVEAK